MSLVLAAFWRFDAALGGENDLFTYRSRKSKASSATGRPLAPTTTHSA